jgi:hypothetical protein
MNNDKENNNQTVGGMPPFANIYKSQLQNANATARVNIARATSTNSTNI